MHSHHTSPKTRGLGDFPTMYLRKRRCFSTKLAVWPLFSLLCLEKTQSVRGMASKAKIAMYKSCWVSGCAKSDMAAAMEKAIEDGVDVLSVSIGSPDFHTPYYSEPIAIAAFAAADRGIFLACSAGNDGPSPSQIVNTAPWITTVGAGSLDRTFQCNSGWGTARFTWEILSTVKSNVMGKIVVSKGAGVDDGFLIQEAGGVALVGLSWKEIREGTTAQDFPLPSLSVGYREGLEISSYINTTNGSTANIMSQAQTVLGKLRAPMVAASSA